jgi:anthranilate synthase component 1
MTPTYTPTLDHARTLAGSGQLLPVIRELPADLETPVSVYLKLRGAGPSFLLESVERGEQMGRYSLLGVHIGRQLLSQGPQTILRNGAEHHVELEPGQDPLDIVKRELTRYQLVNLEGLPDFVGGAVGYLGYDLVRFFERLPETAHNDRPTLPDMHLLFTDTVVIFDHVKHRLLVVATVPLDTPDDLDARYAQATGRIETIVTSLAQPLALPPQSPIPTTDLTGTTTQAEYEAAVLAAKEYIAAGDIFQVVLSHRLSRETAADPFMIYRALRRLNPSPYLFFLDFGPDPDGAQRVLVGSSPEMMTRLTGRRAEVFPIAGTRPRGATEAEDRALEAELLADPKERAEHVMLVDLGRNDLGRVCDYGTVRVKDLMRVDHYSHVMHIVSHVEGTLRAALDGFDLVRATFPAGTVSGAPKVRAMQIIEQLEGRRRGLYAGAVGYFGYTGNVDTCIAIRTILLTRDTPAAPWTAYIQVGAGLVADSDPATEWRETLHKGRALARAIELAEQALG